MPRKTRMYLPGVTAHVVQRGKNRDACFFAEEDFQFYKEVLAEGLNRYGAQLHAYCLMTNHVHLLITPDFTDSINGSAKKITMNCFERSYHNKAHMQLEKHSRLIKL